MSDGPVIRIVKKKAAHAAHHGGSWKVAYADFVTAMMAFFLVMWIISMDQAIREEIQSYFNDPFSASQSRAGISTMSSGGSNPAAVGSAGLLDAKAWKELALEAQKVGFDQTKKRLRKSIDGRPDLSQLGQHVKISVSASGLRIDLIEAEDSLFFESGSATLPARARKLLGIIARELGRLPQRIVIEGHTDVVPYHSGGEYSNWELSADRANAARRTMEALGLRSRQVVEVRGYADSKLRDAQHPRDRANRRVSILVNYIEKSSPGDAAGEGGKSGGGQDQPFSVKIRPE